MAIHDDLATLVGSPSYPNSIAWSKENLIAIASGHLITILNPASPVRPRGLITIPPINPLPVGVIKREEHLTPCIMPISLGRNVSPCVRSISWSPPGFAPNAGCLLALCTTEGRVKVYRQPFCEFRPEWVECFSFSNEGHGVQPIIVDRLRRWLVVDISDMLYDYLKRINFRELNDPLSTFFKEQVNTGNISESEPLNGVEDSILGRLARRTKIRASSRRIQEKYVELLREELPNGDVDHLNQNKDDDYDPTPRKKSKAMSAAAINPCSSFKEVSCAQKSASQHHGRQENDALALITARQYASRSMLLSSLIVSWSPTLQSSGGDNLNVRNSSILAVGGKSGNISFWRIYEPQCYTIEHGRVPVDPVLIGFLQAHNSWITAISWGMHATSSSESHLIMTTGSCDGSVKIWLGGIEELIKSSEADNAPLSLLREVSAVTSVPVSIISLVVPLPSSDKVVFAIGRGSGSLEACVCHISSNKLQTTGVHNAHNQVVTGLAWAFDGGSLYSCSQDNSVRSWVLHGSSLCESPFPLSSPGFKRSVNLSEVSDLCFGLALSPGGLVVAVVRSFDSELLNPMYQARTQKAAVEFYWTGGQLLAVPSEKHLEDSKETCSGFSERDLVCWESTILWCLKHCDRGDEPLVLWDIVIALLTIQKSAPSFVQKVLLKWISSWLMDYQFGYSIKKILFQVQSMLSKMSTRRLHLLIILCRRLMLGESKLDIHHEEMHNFSTLEGEEGGLHLWNEVLVNSERELQERFVSFSFKTVIRRASCSTALPAADRSWCPVGVAQMERWVTINTALVHDQLKLLTAKVGELGSRIHLTGECVEEERCCYCSSPVCFESERFARCEGIKHQNGSIEKHELKRCAVSMKLASVTSPMWFCMCCERQTFNLPPLSFFTMAESLYVNCESERFALQESSKPLCLFCGILLKRVLPDFLLSASPV